MSVANFRDDRLYQKIERAVASILAQGKVVAPVDVLIVMGLLKPDDLKTWRRGRIPYLERAIGRNLTCLSRRPRILRFHAHHLKLMPSGTAYLRWAKGPKQPLRFTKTGDTQLEKVYATHFGWPGNGGISESIRPRNRKGLPAGRNAVLEATPNRAHASYGDFAPLRSPPQGSDRSGLVVNK